jgi:uncharacterized protein YndB with AHSA1/START domain
VPEFRISHGTFVIERRYKHPVSRVFSSFSTTEEKRKWFAVDRDSYELDFRVGGTERSRWVWSGSGPIEPGTVMGNDTVYLDIVMNHRIVLAYSMLLGDYRMSSSLLTFEFFADGEETALKATEQGAYFERSDGVERRQNGWGSILDTLGASLDDNR